MKASPPGLSRLFAVGVVGDLSDAELLERFVERKDEAVFEAIVERHGPMVWGVCRRMLRDHHDAEDAFQAAFLVLARKAASVCPREKLGNWLHGVAYQTARKARAVRAKRRTREAQRLAGEPLQTCGKATDPRLEVLDQELARLPAHYQMAIVLCELEGLSHAEAARRLGWPVGTVSSRLSRGRSRLAKRLALPSSAMAAVLNCDIASAGMPTQLVASTTSAAARVAAAGMVSSAEMVSASVVGLTREVLRTMLSTRIKFVGTVLLITATLGLGGLLRGTPTVAKAEQVGKALEGLQGIWVGGVAEFSGRPSTPSEDMPPPKAEVYIRDDRLTLRGPIPGRIVAIGTPSDNEFTLAADSGQPDRAKILDLTLVPEPDDDSPTVYPGLYWLNGDELILCLAAPHKKHPSKLRTEVRTTQILYKLKHKLNTKWKPLPPPSSLAPPSEVGAK